MGAAWGSATLVCGVHSNYAQSLNIKKSFAEISAMRVKHYQAPCSNTYTVQSCRTIWKCCIYNSFYEVFSHKTHELSLLVKSVSASVKSVKAWV